MFRSSVSYMKFGRGTGAILFKDMTCDGTETSLQAPSCLRSSNSRYCSHDSDVGVWCDSLDSSGENMRSYIHTYLLMITSLCHHGIRKTNHAISCIAGMKFAIRLFLALVKIFILPAIKQCTSFVCFFFSFLGCLIFSILTGTQQSRINRALFS